MSKLISGADSMSYLRRKVELEFSFKVPTTNTDPPTVVRDGRGAQIASVSAPAAGVYTITFKSGIQIPRQLTAGYAHVQNPAGTTTLAVEGNLVADSYSASTRTVTVACLLGTANTAAPPIAGSWVSVRLVGPLVDGVKDAA